MNLPDTNITKADWYALKPLQKKKKLEEVMDYLMMIDAGGHPLAGKPEQGKITQEKVCLETFLKFVILLERQFTTKDNL